jgi:peptidyl-dipeptidase Dcp
MMKQMSLLSLAILFVMLTSFNKGAGKQTSGKSSLPASNPFSSQSTLPYQAPRFDKIKDADFKPALEEGMKVQLQEIEKIANNTAAPTFENTFVAIEKSGQLLTRVNNVFSLLTGANTNPDLQNLQEEVAPKLAAIQDAIYLNSKLFKRIQTVYNNRSKLKLDPESKRLVEYQYQEFLLAGAKLSEADKTKLRKLNEEEASLAAKFTNQLLGAAKAGAVVINDSSALAGLSKSDMDAFQQNAKANNLTGKWQIPLQNTTQQPVLQSLANRSTRQNVFDASINRAERGDSNDTRNTITRLAQIRLEKAKLVGFQNYATWKLQDQMAKTPGAVEVFFSRLVPSATAKAKRQIYRH